MEKTDPRLDRDVISAANQRNKGYLLDLIRLCKKWNKVKNKGKMPSYILETILIHYANSPSCLSDYIDYRFRDALFYIKNNILSPVYDIKGIQGDINSVSIYDRFFIQTMATLDYETSCLAGELELKGDHKRAIEKWQEVFGDEFPDYE